MQSEEQYKPIGTCPDCEEELVMIGDKVKWHDCPYNGNLDVSYNRIITQLQPVNLVKLVEDILFDK